MSRRLPVLAALVTVLALLAPPALASGTSAADTGAGRLSPGFSRDLASLTPTTPYGAFVRVQDGGDVAAVVADHAADLQVVRTYPMISAAYVVGPIGSIATLSSVPSVEYIEDNYALEWHNDTGTWASGARIAQENVAGGPFTAGTGGPALTGAGVGVAVVDSGIFAAHPDLENRVDKNFKFVCSTPLLIYVPSQTCFGNAQVDLLQGNPIPTFGFVDVGDTTSDTASGHGTHVSGIIAGDGTQSTGNYPAGTGPNVKGTYTGVAPGATLYGYGAGEGISLLFAVEALSHIYVYGNSFNPRISVVNNSWGNPGGSAFNSNGTIEKLTDKIVDNNVTMVFSASNDGGNGSVDLTSGYCKNPKAGVICVANYDDETNPGGRDGNLDTTSSRGKSSDTSTFTFPDISAPGTLITSPCVREVQPICNFGYIDEARWGPWYSSISGTSMAAPHISGVIALLLEADNAMASVGPLSPGAIENVLQDSAYRYTSGGPYIDDPQNPDDTPSTTDERTSFDKGAGLVDVKAALTALGVPGTAATAANCLQLIGGDGGDLAGPKAADLESLCVTQTATGFTYELKVVDAADFLAAPSVQYRLFQKTGGIEFTTNVNVTSAGVATAGPATPPTAAAGSPSVSFATDTITFSLTFAQLGNGTTPLPAGQPVIGVQVAAYVGTAVDAAPSNDPALVMLLNRPMYGKPYARV